MRAGQWLLVGVGTDKLTLLPALLQQVRKAGRPAAALAGDKLFELEADPPRLANWFPVFAKNPLPPTLLTVFGRGENLRTEAKFRFSAPLPWKFEPWRLATNMIQDPIISFTVGQGIAPLLGQIEGMPELGLKQMPNQFCTWAQAGTPWQTFVTMPVANASNFIQKLAPAVPKIVQQHLGNTTGEILWASNRAELRWQGLPFVTPSLRALHTNSGDFLFFSMFPRAPKTNPPPSELFAQMAGRNNLVYYDWEITQERLHELRQLGTLLSIAKSWPEALSTSPTRVWLTKVGPMLGNTITEATLTAPNELTLVRKSHLGLTGFELVYLTRWLESPAFPWRFEPSPKPRPPGWTNRVGKPSTNKAGRASGPILAIRKGRCQCRRAPIPPPANRVRLYAVKLGVNIDHVATLREARYRGRDHGEPDVIQAARACLDAGAHGITAHLREDRRHIQDRDIWKLREIVTTRLNLEMANAPEIIEIALRLKPRNRLRGAGAAPGSHHRRGPGRRRSLASPGRNPPADERRQYPSQPVYRSRSGASRSGRANRRAIYRNAHGRLRGAF